MEDTSSLSMKDVAKRLQLVARSDWYCNDNDSQIIDWLGSHLPSTTYDLWFDSQTMRIQSHSWAIHYIQATKGSSWRRAMHWISWDIWTPPVAN